MNETHTVYCYRRVIRLSTRLVGCCVVPNFRSTNYLETKDGTVKHSVKHRTTTASVTVSTAILLVVFIANFILFNGGRNSIRLSVRCGYSRCFADNSGGGYFAIFHALNGYPYDCTEQLFYSVTVNTSFYSGVNGICLFVDWENLETTPLPPIWFSGIWFSTT